MGIPSRLHGRARRLPFGVEIGDKRICPSCRRVLPTLKIVVLEKEKKTIWLCPFCSYEFTRLKLLQRDISPKTDVVFTQYQDDIVFTVEQIETEKIKLEASPSLQIDDSTIVGMMVSKKVKNDAKTYMFLILSLLAHIIFVVFTKTTVNYWLVLFIIFLAGTLYANRQLLEYRIRKGYYGANEYEAREIIQYILEHADATDFTGGNGIKKLMPNPEIELREKILPEGGLAA